MGEVLLKRRPVSLSIARLAHRLWLGWQEDRRYRRDIRHLERLPDHILRDIGLEQDPFGVWRRVKTRAAK